MLTISSVAVSPVPPQAPTVARVQPTTPAKVSDKVSPENLGVVAPVAPAGEGSRAQVVYAPSSLPPVNPTGEAARANNFNNAAAPERMGVWPAGQAPDRVSAGADDSRNNGDSGAVQEPPAQRPTGADAAGVQGGAQNLQAQQAAAQAEREQKGGEQVPEIKNPALEAMDTQIKELLPNMWKASRAAVDVLIGEEARAAAAARAELLVPPKATVPAERAAEAAENYARTSTASDRNTQGVNLDRLV